MLVLFESAVGFSLFKLADGGKLEDKNLHKEFESPESANNLSVASAFPFNRNPPFKVAARDSIKKIIHQAREEEIGTGELENGRERTARVRRSNAGTQELIRDGLYFFFSD